MPEYEDQRNKKQNGWGNSFGFGANGGRGKRRPGYGEQQTQSHYQPRDYAQELIVYANYWGG
jgi:hypothetical protein